MTDADDFFRAKALELGWLKADPHEPGNGRGLWAFYRDAGIHPPEYLERDIPQHEMTGLFNQRFSGQDAPIEAILQGLSLKSTRVTQDVE